jgi:hypothetical protein
VGTIVATIAATTEREGVAARRNLESSMYEEIFFLLLSLALWGCVLFEGPSSDVTTTTWLSDLVENGASILPVQMAPF